MAEYSYAIAAGHDVADIDLVNIETLIPYAPTVIEEDAVRMLPPNKKVTIGGRASFNGKLRTVWNWGALKQADFDALIDDIFGGYDVGTVAVTIKTRCVDWGMKRYNAYAHQPQLGVDFKQHFGGDVEDLRITFYIVGTTDLDS